MSRPAPNTRTSAKYPGLGFTSSVTTFGLRGALSLLGCHLDLARGTRRDVLAGKGARLLAESFGQKVMVQKDRQKD
ncbi:hypothetical protein XELAEV_180434162mg, partial [Xenopus laevis]